MHGPPALRAPDFAVAPPMAPEPRSIDLKLKPVLDGREIGHVEVSLRFSEPPGEFAEPRPLVLAIATDRDGEGSSPDAFEDVSARDAEGALSIHAKQGGTWQSDRRPSGAVTVAYRVRIPRAEAAAQGGARAIAGGFLGTGAALLMLPETADAYALRVAWELDRAGEGAQGAASIDGGTRATVERLRGALFMAGTLGRATIEVAGSRVEGAWLGKGGADPIEVIAFGARVHERERAFFRDADATAYSVMVRAAPGLKAGASAHARSHGVLVLAGDEPGLGGAAKVALAREVARHWIGGDAGLRFEGEAPARALEAGLAAQIGREVALGAGLVTAADVEAELRGVVERSATRGAREVGEERGALYAADVDAAIREKSGGKRSLDDVVHALLDRARGAGGAALPLAAWREIVRAELGPEAEVRFEAALVRGEAFTPRGDAFGPCFKPAKKRVPRPEAGHDGAAGGPKGRAAATVEVTVWARDPKATWCARGKAR